MGERVALFGDCESLIWCYRPIPIVWLNAAIYDSPEKVRLKLCELFPSSRFAELRAKYRKAFEGS